MRLTLLWLLSSLFLSIPGEGQSRELIIRVRSLLDDRPLANAEVLATGTAARWFASSAGIARAHLPAGVRRLRVRQLGFAFRDVEIPAGDTLDVALERLAFGLPPVYTRTSSACDQMTSANDALAAWALSQLQEGAERFVSYRSVYPFDVTVLRKTVRAPGTKRAESLLARERTHSSEWGEPYKPGAVVELQALGFSVRLLFLAALGDPAFWEHHCAIRAEVQGEPARRAVSLWFVPAPHITTTDWAGVALIDSATSELRRLDFRLHRPQEGGPVRLEGSTVFRRVAEHIHVPDSTVAMWWYQPPGPDSSWGLPSAVQQIAVRALRFRKKPPP